MAKVMVIGCGNVGSVGLRKMVQFPEIFSEITVATRSAEKAQKVKSAVWKNYPGNFNICELDVSKRGELETALVKFKPHLLVHWGHPFDNLTIMQACLENGVPYIDTACYEHPKALGFSHKRQWEMSDDFRRMRLLALLGAGFDPGVTNTFCAYARDYLYEKIYMVDILDCNAGKKAPKYKFAPNFDPELNLRELVLPVKFWEEGKWQDRGRLIDENPVKFDFEYPEISSELGPQQTCMIYHEEMESLVKHLPHLHRIRFFMTFSDAYLWHLRVLDNVGMIGIEPVEFEGHKIIPVKFLKSLLPKGEEYNQTYTGKTCIGCVISGLKDSKWKNIFIYQICDHHDSFLETGGNAIGYTTAVPTVTAAKLILEGRWGKGVYGVRNIEDPQFDSKVFLEELSVLGLPWKLKELEEIPQPLRPNY